MKGLLLAGGTGSRLMPLTRVTNKHLLPVYDKPMIFYPLQTLLDAGIREIMIISGPEHLGDITELLGSGKEWGAHFTYRVQDKALGIAQAIGMAADFAANDAITVVLGDSIFEDTFRTAVETFTTGARIFLKKVHDPERFGVPTLAGKKVLKITEKPKSPDSPYAQTGIYIYDQRVFAAIKTLKPSQRGELEVTDLNNWYIAKGEMDAEFLKGFWTDAGTIESLFAASELVRKKRIKNK